MAGAAYNAAEEFLDQAAQESEPSAGVDCYPSFTSFKRDMERKGKKPPAEYQWHHIVEQNPTNQERFPGRLHCTDNLIAIPDQIHTRISGFYSSKPRWTKGKTVRQVISARSWQKQYDYGVKTLRRHGVDP